MCEVAKKKEMNWSRKVSILTAESQKMCFLYVCLHGFSNPELLTVCFWSPAGPEQVSLTDTNGKWVRKMLLRPVTQPLLLLGV